MNTLPIYLQKYLIKIICNHINYKNEFNKLYPVVDIKKDLKEKEKEFKMTIALVNKVWFGCLSNNLNVTKDFYGLADESLSSSEESKFRILKRENIRVLKLVQYYNEIENFDYHLKKRINKLKNLEKIIVCRYFSQKELIRTPQTFTMDFLNKLFKSSTSGTTDCQQANSISPSIKIDLHISLYCNYFGFPEKPTGSSQCQFKVNRLKIDSCCDEESSFSVMDYIKYFNPIKLSIVPSPSLHTSNDPHFKYKKILDFDKLNNNSNGNTVFSFLEKLSISKVSLEDVLSIKEIYYILKSLPQLKSLSFQMCMESMICKFTDSELSKRSISNNSGSNFLYSWEKPDFYFYWEKVREMITYHKHLSSLKIGTGCINNCCKDLTGNSTTSNEPSSFNDNFIKMISDNKSIKSLSLLNFNNNEIINNISSFKNISIK